MVVLSTAIRGRRWPQPSPALSQRESRAGAGAAAALTAVLATHLFDFGSEQLRVRLLNANSSASWSHLAVAGLLVLAAAVAAIRAATGPGRGKWSVVAVVLVTLCVSELTPLHTQIDRWSWGKLVYVPLLVAFALAVWRLPWRRERRLIGAGLAVLALSYAIHIFGPHVLAALGLRGNGWPYQIKVGVKQGTELAGWLLVVAGITARPAGRSAARPAGRSAGRAHDAASAGRRRGITRRA